MPGQQTIDPKKVVLSVVGSPPIVMFAKGTYITAEYDSDAFTDEVGATGDVVRIANADKRGTIKFSLMRNSPSNDVLSALANVDRLTGSVTAPTICKDLRGTSLIAGLQSWVKKIPPAPFATESVNVDWEVRVASMDMFIGGTAT